MEMGRADESQELDELLNGGYRYAMSLCHDPAEAEDLVQDACARILGTGGPMERPYLLTTIRNRFIDRYRRSRRIVFMSIESNDDENPGREHPSDERWQMPDIIASDHLRDALAELRPDEREMLYLAVVEEYTAQEIADMTKRPRGSVLSAIFRTKRKLRDHLAAREVWSDESGQA